MSQGTSVSKPSILSEILEKTSTIKNVPEDVKQLVKSTIKAFGERMTHHRHRWFVVCINGTPPVSRIIGVIYLPDTPEILGRTIRDLKSFVKLVDSSVVNVSGTEEVCGYYNLVHLNENDEIEFKNIYSLFPLMWRSTSSTRNLSGVEYIAKRMENKYNLRMDKILDTPNLETKVVCLLKTLELLKENPISRFSGEKYSSDEICKTILASPEWSS